MEELAYSKAVESMVPGPPSVHRDAAASAVVNSSLYWTLRDRERTGSHSPVRSGPQETGPSLSPAVAQAYELRSYERGCKLKG